MQKSIKIYKLGLDELRTYLFVLLFVTGNIILPQLCHLIPDGGKIFLPIYFFTLIGAYKYGIKVGLITAVLSPVVNSLLFGMPTAAALSGIMIKSMFLAIAASWIAEKNNKLSLWTVLLVVLSYQIFGTVAEWCFSGSLMSASQDFRLGIPGMLIQWIAGYAILRWCSEK